MTINTNCGLCLYTRLPFGVSSDTAIFQKATDIILQELLKVIRYFDNILVTFIDRFCRCYTNVTYCRNYEDESHCKELPVVARIGQRARAAS